MKDFYYLPLDDRRRVRISHVRLIRTRLGPQYGIPFPERSGRKLAPAPRTTMRGEKTDMSQHRGSLISELLGSLSSNEAAANVQSLAQADLERGDLTKLLPIIIRAGPFFSSGQAGGSD